MKAKMFLLFVSIISCCFVFGQTNNVTDLAGHIAYLVEPNYSVRKMPDWYHPNKTQLLVDFYPEDSSMLYMDDDKLKNQFLLKFGRVMIAYAMMDSLSAYNKIMLKVARPLIAETFEGDVSKIYLPAYSADERLLILTGMMPFKTNWAINNVEGNCKTVCISLDIPESLVTMKNLDFHRYSYTLARVVFHYVLQESDDFIKIELHLQKKGKDFEAYYIDLKGTLFQEIAKI